jgi:plastocyanin
MRNTSSSMRRTILSMAAFTMVLVACSSGGAKGQPFQVNGTPVRTDRVDLPKSLRFAPAVIQISAGTTVTWTNNDQFPHTVKLLDGSKIDKALPIGGTATITFTKAGTIFYTCAIHPQMHAKIVVTP